MSDEADHIPERDEMVATNLKGFAMLIAAMFLALGIALVMHLHALREFNDLKRALDPNIGPWRRENCEAVKRALAGDCSQAPESQE
jgi:hypothetical protein